MEADSDRRPPVTAAEMAAATPEGRERYVDFLRAFSLGVVVVGHWLMAVIVRDEAGFVADNALALIPGVWLATWLLQVMPLFFFVGGFSNLIARDSNVRRGGDYASFLAARAGRLMRPTLAFAGAWIPVAVALQWILPPTATLRVALQVVAQPLWFLSVYLFVVALAPAMLLLHRRAPAVTLAALVGGVAVVDVLRIGLGVPMIGILNAALVWLFVHQLGFFYADGTLRRLGRAGAGALALGGLGALALLTTAGPYPGSMVGLPGESMSNMNPPSICIAVLAVWQVGLAMLLRDPVSAWLERQRVWTAVVGASGVIMTLFLWHLTALLAAVVILLPTAGFLFNQEAGSAGWWALRPVWILAAAALLAPLVALFGRFERPPPPAPGRTAAPAVPRRRARRTAAAGVGFMVVGLLGFALGGFSVGGTGEGAGDLVDRLHPLQSALHILVGLALVRRPVSPGPDRHWWLLTAGVVAASAALALTLAGREPVGTAATLATEIPRSLLAIAGAVWLARTLRRRARRAPAVVP